MQNHESAPRRAPLWRTLLIDLLLTLLILGLFLFFKIGLPAIQARSKPSEPDWAPIEAQTSDEPEPTEELAAEPTPEPTPDLRSPWQIRFAEFFTDEPVMTENSYSSPCTSIQLTSFERDYEDHKAVVHVADIHIAFPEQFYTYVADNDLSYWSVQPIPEMDAAAHAILSISGDCITFQEQGLLLRNGTVYLSTYPREDICVLYRDGRLQSYQRSDYTVDELLAEDPAQIWCFGPALLDKQGQPILEFKNLEYIDGKPHPRCAMGYFEPGHYCFVVVDGRREGYSDGVYLGELATIMAELGCVDAYNLDGGGTAVMYFNHEPYSTQSNGGRREIGDIVVIGEPGFN